MTTGKDYSGSVFSNFVGFCVAMNVTEKETGCPFGQLLFHGNSVQLELKKKVIINKRRHCCTGLFQAASSPSLW